MEKFPPKTAPIVNSFLSCRFAPGKNFLGPWLAGERTRGASVPITPLKGLLSRSPVTLVLPSSVVTPVPSSYLSSHSCCLTHLLLLSSTLLATSAQSSWMTLPSLLQRSLSQCQAQAFSLLYRNSLLGDLIFKCHLYPEDF